MKALIFAAGRGERLKPLTDHTPKPLARVHNKPLIQYHIEALMHAGITDVVINVSWLHQQIIDFVTELVQNSAFRMLNVQFSIEPEHPLETGGGMLKALPLLDDAPFIVVNADIFTDFDFSQLQTELNEALVNVVLVKNPVHNASGDFGINHNQLTPKTSETKTYTYAGIGCYSPQILTPPFDDAVFSIVPYIKAAIQSSQARAQLHSGYWHDVGTIERLDELNQR